MALLILRCVIGFHFFMQGIDKIDSGTFTAEYFLKGAKGPAAPLYQEMLEDKDSIYLLCIDEEAEGNDKVSPSLTLQIWDDYKREIATKYRFGDEKKVAKYKKRREEDKNRIAELDEQLADFSSDCDSARSMVVELDGDLRNGLLFAIDEVLKNGCGEDSEQDYTEMLDRLQDLRQSVVDHDRLMNDRNEVEERYKADEQRIKLIRNQVRLALQTYEKHAAGLKDYLATWSPEINEYRVGLNRLDGFDRDGDNRSAVASQVSYLSEQMDTIKSDMNKKVAPIKTGLKAAWDQYESDMNAIVIDEERGTKEVSLFRPFQKGPLLQVVDKWVPWFDLTVGILLFIGLFTRLAALAGAGFLASIITTQLPGSIGAAPTYDLAIEFAALLVLFATCAGRFGGLDYFLHLMWRSMFPPKMENVS